MTQKQINAAYNRSLKTTYKHLSPVQKRLVKLQEQIEQNDKDIMMIERALIKTHGDNWRKAVENSDTELFFSLNLDNIKLSEKITRIEEKHNLDRTEVMKYHRMCNVNFCYGGSF